MTITWNQIKQFLELNQIPFEQIHSLPQETFEVASLFSPIDNGFYFYNAEAPFFADVKNSIILVNSKKAITTSNCFILIETQDVQLVYYELLNYYFEQRSTGKISSLVEIDKEAKIDENVQIDAFSIIGKSKIGKNCIIGSHCKIYDNVEIGDNTIIETGSIIGTKGVAWIWKDKNNKITQPQLGGVTIGENCFLGANTIIVRGSLNEHTTLFRNVMLAPSCRLGHGTIIKENVHFANNVITGGNVSIGKNSFVGSGAIFRPKVHIHENTIVAAGAVVVKNTSEPKKTLTGCPAKETEAKENPSGMPKPLK